MIAIFLTAGLICLVVQMTFFAFAWISESDKFTDLAYGLTFVVVAWAYFLTSARQPVQLLILLMVTLWGARLAGWLFWRILKLKSDSRFDGIRNNTKKLAQFWTGQAVAAWIILWPTIFLLDYNRPMPVGWLTMLGAGVWMAGWLTETAADAQKAKFKAETGNTGKWVNRGLWKYSRHPNYFGEILCWWGIFIVALPYLSGWAWIVAIGPVLITYLILLVTGIPVLEKKYDKIYANDKEFLKYRKSTSLIVPWWVKS